MNLDNNPVLRVRVGRTLYRELNILSIALHEGNLSMTVRHLLRVGMQNLTKEERDEMQNVRENQPTTKVLD